MTGLHFNLLTDVAATQARLIEHTKMWHRVRPSASVCVLKFYDFYDFYAEPFRFSFHTSQRPPVASLCYDIVSQ